VQDTVAVWYSQLSLFHRNEINWTLFTAFSNGGGAHFHRTVCFQESVVRLPRKEINLHLCHFILAELSLFLFTRLKFSGRRPGKRWRCQIL